MHTIPKQGRTASHPDRQQRLCPGGGRRHPFWTVLHAYVSRWQFWLVLSFWLCQVAGFAPAALRQRGSGSIWPMLLMAVGYTSAAIAFQVKEQLGAYRSALLPNFRTPHLAAGLFWVALTVLPFPVITSLGGGSALGALGVALPIAGLGFAGCCRGGWRALVFGSSFLLCFLPRVAPAVTAMARGQHPWAAVGFSLSGLWFLGETVFYLATMDEESPAYDLQFRGNLRQLSGPQARRGMLTAMRRLDRTNSIWLRLVDVQIPESMPFVGRSRWQRIVHWRRAHANWWLAAAMPAVMWAAMLAIHYFMQHGRTNRMTFALRSTLWVLILMPATTGLNVWQTRGGMLARELTYPVRRRDFVFEQAVSILLSQFGSWLLLVGVVVLVLTGLPGRIPWYDVVVAAAVSGPWQLVAFALLARLSTLGSAIPMIVGLILATLAGTAILMGCVLLNSLPVTAFVASAITVLGVATLVLAHRHWLRVDIV